MAYHKVVFPITKTDMVFGCLHFLELEDFLVKFGQKRGIDSSKRYMIEVSGLIPALLRVSFPYVGFSLLLYIVVC
jgi:hypothetical protein